MIEDPPLLTIKSRTHRIADDLIAELSRYPTGFVVDAMQGRGALNADLQPLSRGTLPVACCGRVLTVDPGPADVLAVIAALDEIEEGDVLVIATDSYRNCAAIGDRVIGMARNCGAVGIVTDGLVRDVEGIEAVGLPVYCCGVSPNSPYNNGPGYIGTDISIGNVTITGNDALLADVDGAVVVPGEKLQSVLEQCRHIETIEKSLDQEVADGLKVPAAIQELLASDKVKRI